MTRYSEIISISESKCDETKTVTPSFANFERRSLISWIPAGSSPLVGSSRINNLGLGSKAAAIPNLCFMPSE